MPSKPSGEEVSSLEHIYIKLTVRAIELLNERHSGTSQEVVKWDLMSRPTTALEPSAGAGRESFHSLVVSSKHSAKPSILVNSEFPIHIIQYYVT